MPFPKDLAPRQFFEVASQGREEVRLQDEGGHLSDRELDFVDGVHGGDRLSEDVGMQSSKSVRCAD